MNDPYPLSTKLRLALLAIFAPDRFTVRSLKHTLQLHDPYASTEDTNRSRVSRLRDGYRGASIHIAFVLVIGVAVGRILVQRFESDPGATILGGFGGLIILWATLALRGWEIQSFNGSTLPELVNRWIYRGACSTGTLLLIVAASWAYG